MSMYLTCLDLEGVLVPEIWIAFAAATGIEELKRTTRDEPDYDKLMKYRIDILKQHNLGLKEIQDTIRKIDPLPGAKEFLDELRSCCQTIILSDTFTQFAAPLMEKLGQPTFKFDKDNGVILVSYPDGTTATMEGFLVEGKDIRIATDSTLGGNGTIYNPLRLAEVETTGTF